MALKQRVIKPDYLSSAQTDRGVRLNAELRHYYVPYDSRKGDSLEKSVLARLNEKSEDVDEKSRSNVSSLSSDYRYYQYALLSFNSRDNNYREHERYSTWITYEVGKKESEVGLDDKDLAKSWTPLRNFGRVYGLRRSSMGVKFKEFELYTGGERCVSKCWCALIDTPEFAKLHLKHSPKTNSNIWLLLRETEYFGYK
ncbi:hypothetical protein RND71_009707 [Anisodus tanguticus]|uniref:Uncharacterized protein n=1 Tax=Anisodus tanguticus TaxID=243964 RepID=A0AAE1SIU1_9SOLA|nr:hypothetical protein RND71_009707 [Anisodus tanguticus]